MKIGTILFRDDFLGTMVVETNLKSQGIAVRSSVGSGR